MMVITQDGGDQYSCSGNGDIKVDGFELEYHNLRGGGEGSGQRGGGKTRSIVSCKPK